MARQQVMSIINSNAKTTASTYNDPYECWTGLKAISEFDSRPRRVMFINKFFALRKTESISMDTHLTKIQEIANFLDEVDVNTPEDIIVYYTLKNMPKEYEIFKRMQIAAQTLSFYEQLEAKLISKETSIRLETQQKEDGEPFFLHRDRRRRPQPTSRYGHPPITLIPCRNLSSTHCLEQIGSSRREEAHVLIPTIFDLIMKVTLK